MESNFLKLDSLTTAECCIIGGKLKGVNGYGFQYVGVIIKERKYIYINAFPVSDIEMLKKYGQSIDLTKTPMGACDGGLDFWGALFDIETKTFSQLSFNGAG